MNLKRPLVIVAKYLAHGLLFGLLTFGVVFLWAFLAGILASTGALIGLLLSFVILAIGWGVANSLVSRLLWFPMRKGWKVYLPQGTLLFITFFLVEYLPVYAFVPLLLEFTLMEQTVVVVILNVVYALVDGYLAKSIAGHWKVRGVQTEALEKAALLVKEPEVKPNNPGGVHCPRCSGVNLVVAPDKSAYCLDCKRGLRRETMGGTAG